MFSLLDWSDSGNRAYKLERLHHIEAKLDIILSHLGLKYVDPSTPASLSNEVKSLIGERGRKIEAIKLHRQQTGAGLREAKHAVEAYTASRAATTPA